MFRKLTLIFAALALATQSTPAFAAAETILVNGKIITVDAKFSYAQAIAIENGKILAVGSNDQIRKLATADTRIIDLRGKAVIPGLADNHLHNAGGGPGVDLSRVRTMAELLDKVAERAKRSEPGEIIISNSDWHEGQLKELRLPLRRDLDRAAPANPVVLVRGGHSYLLNSRALEKWNITKSTPEPQGGRISRYKDGELNGELVDRAKDLVSLPRVPDNRDLEARIRDQQAEYRKLNAAGLTSVRHPGSSVEQYRLLQEMQRRGLLTMRVNFLVRLNVSDPAAVAKTIASWNIKPDEGDAWLRIGGIKLGVDGGFEGGWMRKPYAEPWGEGGKFYGLNTVPENVFTGIVREINKAGWRVGTHAVGDAGIDEVLNGYTAANSDKSIADRRWAIEHGFLVQPDQLAKMRRLNILLSAQDHLYLAGPSLREYWGKERAENVTPMRSIIDSGVHVSSGTDAAVVPYPPLWTLYHFVTRDTIAGGVFGPKQRISREEALRLATINNAYLNFEENIKGSLEVGKFADLVVLSDDIMTCPEQRIRDMAVLMTMVNGKMVYQHQDFKP